MLQVSDVEYERLRAAADSGALVRVVAQASVERAEAFNLVVEAAGVGWCGGTSYSAGVLNRVQDDGWTVLAGFTGVLRV